MAKKKIGNDVKGTFTKKASGKVEYRICYKDDYGKLQRKSFTGEDEVDCLERADEFMHRLERSKNGISLDATIPELVKLQYEIDFAKNYVGEQGYFRAMDTVRMIEKSGIGDMPIAELTELHMNLFLASITHYSNSTIEKIYQKVKMGFAIAYEKGIINKNIMLSRELRCPKSNKRDKKVRGLTEEEQSIFIETLNNHVVPKGRNDYRIQLFIEMYSGMRMGEINALTPGSIDLKKNVIHVGRTVSRGRDCRTFIKEGAKTYMGVRDVPINRLLKPYITDALDAMKNNPHGLIFYDYIKGNIVTTAQVNSFFKRMCEKSGIPCYGQHALRHTFATRCIEANIPAVVLKNWLGHKDIHMTLDIYADVFKRMEFDSAEQFENQIDKYVLAQGNIAG